VGLPKPLTQVWVNGFKVDFYWRELGLVIETDSLRYHRTASKQTKDLVRDQAHAVADVERLRFSHAQVRFQPAHVEATLQAVAKRLRA
jgi:very-short-patch-repair endonuclease